jgi:hypothetical protein
VGFGGIFGAGVRNGGSNRSKSNHGWLVEERGGLKSIFQLEREKTIYRAKFGAFLHHCRRATHQAWIISRRF